MSPNDSVRLPAAPGWLLPLAIVPLLACQVYAFRWGVIMPDTVFQWGQALSGRYDDWHPPATTWLWRQLMPLGPGPAPILLFQVTLYWAGVWLITDALRRRGSTLGMAAALACAILPIPFGQMGAILKDPLLAACCLAALGLDLATERGGRGRRWALVTACLLLAFASATRFNAVFATAPLLAAWAPRRWLERPSRIGLVLAGSVALLAGANWLIDSALLRPHRSQPIYSLVNFDLAGIVAHGGSGAYPDIDRRDEAAGVARCYDPGQFDPTYQPACDDLQEALRQHAARTGQGPLAIWLGAIARAPLAFVRHRLAHFNRNQRFLVGAVPADAVYIMAIPPNPYGLSFRQNEVTTVVYRAAQAMAVSPLGRPATWLTVAIGLLVVAPRLPSGRLVAAAAGSSLAYGAAYAVVSVAPDLRYNLWTMLAAMIGLVLAAAAWRRGGVTRGRLLLAAAPAAIAVAGEVAALALG